VPQCRIPTRADARFPVVSLAPVLAALALWLLVATGAEARGAAHAAGRGHSSHAGHAARRHAGHKRGSKHHNARPRRTRAHRSRLAKHAELSTKASSPPRSPAPTAPTAPSGTPSSVPPSDEVPAGGSNGSFSAPSPHVTCDLLAAPSGSDGTGDGSVANPFHSVVKLDRALAPGQTGCLRGGTYGDTDTMHQLTNDGTASAQITITSYPGETATVVGWVDVEAAYTTLAGLSIDGSNTFYVKAPDSYCPTPHVVSQALDLAGEGDVFERNDFYQSVPGLRGTGIGVGFWGDADNTTIRFNRIHDVGTCTQHDHLIYLASGNNVQIYDNWLYNDHNGFGVVVYPRPTGAQIYANVIDNAGSGLNFGDNGTTATAGNRAWHNVVTNSFRLTGDSGRLLEAALVMCPELDASSVGNEVVENDSFGNPDGISAVNSNIAPGHISLAGNITADPLYADHSAEDFDVAAGSPVAHWGLWNGS